MAEALTLKAPYALAQKVAPASNPERPDVCGAALEARRPAAATAGPVLTVIALPSITEIPRDAWNRLFRHAGDGWDYFRACELTTPPDFTFSVLAAFAGETLVAAVPMFRVDYRLDMTLDERFRPVGDWLHRHAPRLVSMPVMGLGSPLTEECPLGFLPGMGIADRASTLAALLRGFADHARAADISVLAIKDVTDADALWAHEPLTRAGFCRMASLPVATLPLPFKDENGYYAALPPKMRNDVRRKMRHSSAVKAELRASIDDVHDEIVALYRETRAKRKTSYDSFDEVPEGYFREMMRNMGGKAEILLCRVNGDLAAFNFFVTEPHRVIGKFIGMRYPLAREHNIYFFNWMTMVRLCIERGIPQLQTGQTTYALKVRLGCKLKRSWVYFQHRGAILGPVFRKLGPLIPFDQVDPDLKELGATAPYLAPEGTAIDAHPAHQQR